MLYSLIPRLLFYPLGDLYGLNPFPEALPGTWASQNYLEENFFTAHICVQLKIATEALFKAAQLPTTIILS